MDEVEKTTSVERARFARDVPVDDLETGDHFGHYAYSKTLARAVLDAVPPFTIGVFASWGVGKTTIAKDHLERALGESGASVAYAYFDVWKYEGDSLRRQFLRDTAA